jgi:hypothetical protein
VRGSEEEVDAAEWISWRVDPGEKLGADQTFYQPVLTHNFF